MVNPISRVHANDVQSSSPPSAKPERPVHAPQTAKSGELSHDDVTLKSAGQAEADTR